VCRYSGQYGGFRLVDPDNSAATSLYAAVRLDHHPHYCQNDDDTIMMYENENIFALLLFSLLALLMAAVGIDDDIHWR